MKRTKEQMYPLIEAYLASDLTQEIFWRQEGFSIAVLNYWLKKYHSERSFFHRGRTLTCGLS